jgi:hypothetical protein
MHYLRLIFISGIVLFLILTGISLFIPSHVRVSRALDMNSDLATVMAQLRDPASWRNWYPGMANASLTRTNNGIAGLQSPGNDLLLDQVSDNHVTAIYKGRKLKTVTTGWNALASHSGSVTVNWYMDFHLRWYPWEKFSGLLLEKTYGPMLEKGLANLKKSVEN